ncbi:MFS general substrate transporter [Fomitiporia mediterranea MF3/22]|uniref:MFS general substrate transporter n=1 Tax=Fomitiporia mediterranea (strain MF3/22) TaxID=694068 RepID=UPI00044083CA|nr:MFS general substrate transporter [Fomitiporia mediterranea MF3/22]EJD00088.1 MFS general substrate transporter [Fomitiporia mediterranea MF3/22]
MTSREGSISSSSETRVAEHLDDAEFPEGGFRAWMVVLGSFLIYFASFGVINSFGTFQEFYISDFLSNYSATVIAFIGSLQITLLYVSGVVIGPIFDAKGFKYLYPIGMLGSIAALIGLSFTRPHQIWQQFLSQGVLFGFAVGCGYYPALSIVGHYFQRRRALAMGIVAAGSSVGGVCFPIMFSRLFQTIGFAWSVRVAALITLFCYSVAMLISRTRLPLKPFKGPRALVDFGGFRDPRYAVLAFGCVLVNLGLYSPYYYIEPFAVLYGVSDSIHPFLLSMINGVSFFGRIIGGQWADRYGRLNILCPATLISGILCLALWLPSRGAVSFIIFACLYGFFSGIFISVSSAAVGQISPVDKLGARIGTFFLPTAVATLVGTPIGGAFVKTGSKEEYHHVAIFAGSMIVVGSILLYISRLLCSKDIRAKW